MKKTLSILIVLTFLFSFSLASCDLKPATGMIYIDNYNTSYIVDVYLDGDFAATVYWDETLYDVTEGNHTLVAFASDDYDIFWGPRTFNLEKDTTYTWTLYD